MSDVDDDPSTPTPVRRITRRIVPAVMLTGWAAAFGTQLMALAVDPAPWNQGAFAGLVVAFAAVQLHLVTLYRRLTGDWRQALELTVRALRPGQQEAVRARDAFMAEVQREQLRARAAGQPSTLVVATVDLQTIERAHGDRAARAAVRELAGKVARAARATDLIGYLGYGQVCALLTDCSRDEAQHFTRRLPTEVTVSGRWRGTLTFGVTVRLSEFDPLTGEPIDVGDEAGRDPATELLLRLRMKPQARAAA